MEQSTSWMFPNSPCWVQVATEDNDTYPELFARATIENVDGANVTVRFERDEDLNKS